MTSTVDLSGFYKIAGERRALERKMSLQEMTEVKTVTMEVEEKHVIEERMEVDNFSDDKKKKKKKKKEGDPDKMKKEAEPEKKTKKARRTESGKENQSKKTSVNRSESYSVDKKRIHVKSVDPAKVARQFNKSSARDEVTKYCKSCGKQVFQMEQIKAEKEVWHKNCFRCKECSKQLTLDIYESHEGDIYCKPHFKQLFKPKAVFDDESERPRIKKPEMIIRESQPIELPEDVVRSTDKPDYGLEELSQVTDVKSRYQVFEQVTNNSSTDLSRSPSQPLVKRSPSILSRMSKFQNGSFSGVPDDALNGDAPQDTSSSEEEEDQNDGVVRTSRKRKEYVPRMEKMADVRSKWEMGSEREERREELKRERKEELIKLRQAMCMGQTNELKSMYQDAVESSNVNTPSKERIKLEGEGKASSLKEKFEKGGVNDNEEEKRLNEEDEIIFSQARTAKSARNLFKELDASTPKVTMRQNVQRQPLKRWSTEIKQPVAPYDPENVVKASDHLEDIEVETQNVASKFKFFETFKPSEKERKQFRFTPPREGQVREETPEPEETVVKSEEDRQDVINIEATRSIRNKFRMMEEDFKTEKTPQGPKPLKRFTPPPGYNNESEESEEESEEEYSDEEDYSDDEGYRSRIPDEELFALRQERAASLRAKFEQWESQEINHNQVDLLSDEIPSTDTAKNLRQKFEAMKIQAEKPKDRPKPKVNRFISELGGVQDMCYTCEKRVYPLEKLELEKKIFHKNCFRCSQCNSVLRMDSYTINSGVLYCMPHFKQSFLSKGRYDSLTPRQTLNRHSDSE